MELEKTFANHLSDKGLVPRIYKELRTQHLKGKQNMRKRHDETFK